MAWHIAEIDLDRQEVDGNELVVDVWPFLSNSLRRPNIALADLPHAAAQFQARKCGS